MRTIRVLLASLVLTVSVTRNAPAFSLIGPAAPPAPSDNMGSPVNIGEGYRWNVPLVTYTCDQSFLNFFGTNGVAAIDAAMDILNQLPPASAIVPNSYPTNAVVVPVGPPFPAQLLDLKAVALSLVLRQMGLAVPEHYVHYLHDYSVTGGVTNYNVIMRNFDPLTLQPVTNINGVPFSYQIVGTNLQNLPTTIPNFTVAGLADTTPEFAATGLSYDDVGGLRYLYSTNNVALENLLPGVEGVGANFGNYVATATRPGIDQVSFQRVDMDPFLHQLFTPLTNYYTDHYIQNGTLQSQTLARIITQPDIVFSANNVPNGNYGITSAVGWMDNALPGHNGPGLIQPQATITFNRILPSYYLTNQARSGNFVLPTPVWCSSDLVTNGDTISRTNVVTYPAGSAFASATTFNLNLLNGPSPANVLRQYTWSLPGTNGTPFALQVSTNLTDWQTLTAITNNGWGITYMETVTNAARYFRTVPQ